MDHIAIMKKSVGLIPDILSGVKRIESRWYYSRYSPWDKIHIGDRVFFKESGGLVTAYAEVEKVLQFEGLNKELFEEIVSEYGDLINLRIRDYTEYYQKKRYVILIFLKDPQKVEVPFQIDKSGFGSATAWLCVGDIDEVRLD